MNRMVKRDGWALRVLDPGVIEVRFEVLGMDCIHSKKIDTKVS